ncbi:MAG: hypothetical protein ACFFDI_16930 [Promethearchaeota archaeon]
MANIELILLALFLLIIVILIIRYLELVPRLILWFFARNLEDHSLITPDGIGLSAELVEIPANQNLLTAWFFETASNEAGILMVPNWFSREDQDYCLKAAGLLHQAGYNVLLPVYHWQRTNQEWKLKKRSASPKNYEILIRKSYDYLCTRPKINKRNIGIWSNGVGTIIACQLIKDLPIKAVVLEEGPVSLWNSLASYLHSRRYYFLPRIIIHLLLYPFVWRTRWQGKNAIQNLRGCPSFLLANTLDEPEKNLWNIYLKLHKPRKLWFEYALHPNALLDTWFQEYWLQIKSFFDLWLENVPRQDQLELHYDFSVKRKMKEFYPVEVRISVIPPQLEKIPLQIILSDNKRFTERRIWFGPGASAVITWPLKYRPNSISILKFLNVETSEMTTYWRKGDSEKALHATIEKIISYPPEKLAGLMDRYFIQKSVLLNEQLMKEDAKQTLKTEIKSHYWKSCLLRDPETRLILNDDSNEAETTTDSFFVSS